MTAADQILTVAQMRAAEQALIDAGESVESLMERAGTGAADWVWRIACGRPVTVLCGPGNNGGDGYVIARELARRGAKVSVVAPLEPTTDAAISARRSYGEAVVEHGRGGVMVDGLFGSGLTRPLSDELLTLLCGEATHHSQLVAVDLPSGTECDSGQLLNGGLPRYDLTVALGAWKWAHWMMPASAPMGERRLVDIGCREVSGDFTLGRLVTRPHLTAPATEAHKYSRGLVAVVAGAMPGAALLAAQAAQRGGAGYVRLLSDGAKLAVPPDLVADERPLVEALADTRIAAVVVGPGLGRDGTARSRLETVMFADGEVPTVIDGDALALLQTVGWGPRSDRKFVLTPHAGELTRLAEAFEIPAYHPPFARKVHQAIELDWETDATIVAKGPDTVIFNRDRGMRVAPMATAWLATAGTGDVLAGLVGSRLAAGSDPLAAACEAVWLHGEAARQAGPAFTASELARHVAGAYAACL